MLGLSQNQKQIQKLTPQMYQYLNLLNLPLNQLELHIKTELEMNPFLEISDELNQDIEDKQSEEMDLELQQEPPEDDDVNKNNDELTLEDFQNDDGYEGHKTSYNEDDESEYITPATRTLTDELVDQLRMLYLTEEELILAEEILGNIDSDGYLREPIEKILENLNSTNNFSLTYKQAEEVRKTIMTLDPPGIASKSVEECLLVQLSIIEGQDHTVKQNAKKIISEYYGQFMKKHFEEIIKALSISVDDFKLAQQLIIKLNIKPGEGQFSTTENTIIPDFIVTNEDGEIVIILNEGNVPQLRRNKTYQKLLSNNKDKEVKEFAKRNLESTRFFIKAIHQRRDTMMRVMRTIVELQPEFFIEGNYNLKPMIYKDVAEIVKLDIATISRTCKGKYVQTDFGTFELKYFFSESIKTSSGEEVANKQVMQIIKKIIESENKKKPFTDDDIACLLNKDGYNIARRTVAKYRENLNIPVARMRKDVL
jgi:RNA polymerase sigma-54 factor